MKNIFKDSWNIFIIFHLMFMSICIIILLLPFSIGIGIKLFFLVIIYNLSGCVIGFFIRNTIWMEIWVFSFIISIFQIFPDWFLSAELNILVFPDDGLFKIGPVSGYMFGLWTIPLFIIIFIGIRSKEKFNERTAMILVCALSLIIFGTAEATIWIIGSWYPQNVAKIGQLAIYILPAEVILGFSSYYCFTRLNKEHIVYIPLLAFLIMLLYMGSSSFFYLLVEKIIL